MRLWAMREHGSLEVPLRLRNAPTRLMRDLGHGAGYRYAHDEADAFAAGESYFPEDMTPRHYYHPVARGSGLSAGTESQGLHAEP
jgi:putative ATPase